MFQSYALFPFLTVFDNVAFGLRSGASWPRTELRDRVYEALELVKLRSFEKRRPGQLSGGQQQRVALARALVLQPSVLLLDEPLGALDAKLRRSLKVELKALQEQVGITFLYVTHDQEEALTMSDRLAVMRNGKIVQIGEPAEVYEEPADTYVADFLGVSNLMEVDVVERGPGARCQVRLGESALQVEHGAADAAGQAHCGDPAGAGTDRGIRLRGPEPGAGDGRAAGVPRLGHPGDPAAGGRSEQLQVLLQNDGSTAAAGPGHAGARVPGAGRAAGTGRFRPADEAADATDRRRAEGQLTGAAAPPRPA